jgi:hypothetical protein
MKTIVMLWEGLMKMKKPLLKRQTMEMAGENRPRMYWNWLQMY